MTALKRYMTKTSFLFLWLTMLVAMMGGIAAVTKTAWSIGSKSHVGPQRMEGHGFTHVDEGANYVVDGKPYIGFRGRLVGVPAGGTNMTGTTMATWIPEVWSMKPTITYRSNLVAVPLLDHTWEPEIGVGQGDTVNIPGFSQNNAARNRGAGTGTFGTGTSITFDAVTEAQTQLVVNRFYYKAFRQPVEEASDTRSPQQQVSRNTINVWRVFTDRLDLRCSSPSTVAISPRFRIFESGTLHFDAITASSNSANP